MAADVAGRSGDEPTRDPTRSRSLRAGPDRECPSSAEPIEPLAGAGGAAGCRAGRDPAARSYSSVSRAGWQSPRGSAIAVCSTYSPPPAAVPRSGTPSPAGRARRHRTRIRSPARRATAGFPIAERAGPATGRPSVGSLGAPAWSPPREVEHRRRDVDVGDRARRPRRRAGAPKPRAEAGPRTGPAGALRRAASCQLHPVLPEGEPVVGGEDDHRPSKLAVAPQRRTSSRPRDRRCAARPARTRSGARPDSLAVIGGRRRMKAGLSARSRLLEGRSVGPRLGEQRSRPGGGGSPPHEPPLSAPTDVRGEVVDLEVERPRLRPYAADAGRVIRLISRVRCLGAVPAPAVDREPVARSRRRPAIVHGPTRALARVPDALVAVQVLADVDRPVPRPPQPRREHVALLAAARTRGCWRAPRCSARTGRSARWPARGSTPASRRSPG